ncbi:MAG: hypothetical protein Q7U04_06480, partial [Bacteriovorax sp.]|nr:hypothetical protein [Bacteriovorax sp.]
MKQLNKILIVFFVFSFLTIYGGWRFIHSREFSDKASQKVSTILTKKFGAKLAFTGVDFNVFPPSTIFKNIHIEKNDPTLADIDLYVDELIVSFTYASFFSSELQIDDLKLKDGALTVKTYVTNEKDIDWKELDFKNIYNQYDILQQKSPLHLNMARLENINIQVDESSLFIESLSLAPHRKDLLCKIKASQIHVEHKLKDVRAINLNKGELFLRLTKEEWKVENLLIEDEKNNLSGEALFFNQHKTIQVNAKTQFKLNLESILPIIPKIPKELLGIKGDVAGSLVARGNLFDPNIELLVSTKQFKSDWIQLADASIELRKKNNLL